MYRNMFENIIWNWYVLFILEKKYSIGIVLEDGRELKIFCSVLCLFTFVYLFKY